MIIKRFLHGIFGVSRVLHIGETDPVDGSHLAPVDVRNLFVRMQQRF